MYCKDCKHCAKTSPKDYKSWTCLVKETLYQGEKICFVTGEVRGIFTKRSIPKFTLEPCYKVRDIYISCPHFKE